MFLLIIPFCGQYENANAVIGVFDITNRESLLACSKWVGGKNIALFLSPLY